MEVPQTQYAKSGDVSVAYQVLGDGPFDLVLAPGFVSNLEAAWQEPLLADYYRALSSFCRLIVFDKRGTGLSDRVSDIPDLETRMDDVRAILDAVGSERAAVLGNSEGAALAALFAATYPERTPALVLYGTFLTGSGCTATCPRGTGRRESARSKTRDDSGARRSTATRRCETTRRRWRTTRSSDCDMRRGYGSGPAPPPRSR